MIPASEPQDRTERRTRTAGDVENPRAETNGGTAGSGRAGFRGQAEILLQLGLQQGEVRAHGQLVDRSHPDPLKPAGGFEPDIRIGQLGRQLVRAGRRIRVWVVNTAEDLDV